MNAQAAKVSLRHSDLAPLAGDCIGRDAGQADGGEHETEETQAGELADSDPDHALESLEVFVHRASVEDDQPRVSPSQLAADGGHWAAFGHAPDQYGCPLDRGAAEARDGDRGERCRHRSVRGHVEQPGPDVGDHADHDVTSAIVVCLPTAEPAPKIRCSAV